MEKSLYTLDEVEALTGIKQGTLRQRLNRGLLSGLKVPEGKKMVWAITHQTMVSLSQERGQDDFARLFQAYLDEMRSGVYCGRPLTPKHVESMEKNLKRYWDILKDKPSIEGLNAANFKKVMASFEPDFKKKQDFYSTKMHVYKAVTGLMKILIREGYKTELDLQAIRKLLPKKTFKLKKDFLELSEVQEALQLNKDWTRGRRDYDIQAFDVLIALYAFAGLRKMEAANLRMDQVHLEKEYLHVYGKWSKERIVPIFPVLREHINNWLQYRDSDSEWLVPQIDGTQLTEGAINDRFQRFKEKYPTMDKITPHALRRSCATIMAFLGMPTDLIRLMLGHEDLKTTQGYLMLNERHLLDWSKNSSLPLGQAVTVKAEKNESEAVSDITEQLQELGFDIKDMGRAKLPVAASVLIKMLENEDF